MSTLPTPPSCCGMGSDKVFWWMYHQERLNIISHIQSMNHISFKNGTSRYLQMHSSPLHFSQYEPRWLRWVVGNITCTVIILPSSSLSPVMICNPPCMNGRCVNGTCMPCPDGRFGANCTGESHVIKLCRTTSADYQPWAVSSTDKHVVVMLSTTMYQRTHVHVYHSEVSRPCCQAVSNFPVR